MAVVAEGLTSPSDHCLHAACRGRNEKPRKEEMLARKGDDRSLELVQSLTYVVTIALMAVHSQESLDELREAVADANKTLLEEVQERDESNDD